MKKIFFFVLMLAGFAAYAQTVQSTQVELNKAMVPGVSIAIAGYEADFIQNALTHRLEKMAGLKGTNTKGFRLYAAQNYPDFGNLSYSIYTLVDKGSKKDQFVTVYLMVSTGNDNFASQNGDPELTQKMKDFLTDFVPFLKEYDRLMKIDALTATINKLDKEINSLVSDRDKLKKDIDNLQSKLRDKEKDLSNKESEISKAKADLEAIQ
jgi:hypothetical protein